MPAGGAKRSRQCTMHMDRLGPAALVQVIDVLGDENHFSREGFLEVCQSLMRRIGLGFHVLGASHVIEIMDQFGIRVEPFRCRDILDPMLRPKTVFIAEGSQAALGGDTRAGQDYDLVHDGLFLFHAPMTQRILFVCLGNICRSPAAEGIVRTLMPELETDSAGTSGWHEGDPPYGPMQKAAMRRGVDLSDLRARGFRARDFEHFDLIIGMDADNIATMERLRPADNATPVRLFTDYVEGPDTYVPDPYYTRDFDGALDLIERCAAGLKDQLRRQ